MDEVTTIRAVHSYTVFAAENGYTVVKYRHVDGSGYFTACGNGLPTASESEVTLYGKWTEDKKHGKQFEVAYFEDVLPTTLKGFVSYMKELKCGIGKARAVAIFTRFGPDVWDVLENNPERLLEVPKLTPVLVDKLVKKTRETTLDRHILNLFKGSCDVSIAKVKKIIEKFGADSEGVVLYEPYKLCGISGFSFFDVDAMALKNGCDPCSPERLSAAVVALFDEQSSRGHVCIPVPVIRELLQILLRRTAGGINEEEAGKAINNAMIAGTIVRSGQYLYRPSKREEETTIVTNVLRLLLDQNGVEGIDAFLSQYKEESGVILAAKQEEGVKMVLRHSFSILTGGPGTGKTTTLKAILYIHQMVYGNRSEPVLLAPTGKAARRMSEATGFPAATIHSAISYIGEVNGEAVTRNKNGEKLTGNLFIVDEASMIDQSICSLLLAKIPDEARVVFVGDPDQLPSVGCGNVLLDMISSTVVPVTKLDVIFRQGADSPIIRNAHAINEGNTCLDTSSPCFRFLSGATTEEIFNGTLEFYLRCVKAYGLDNTILLCPYRSKTDLCVNTFNKALQQKLNPVKPGAKTLKAHGIEFREGDRVMQLKNTEAAKNGDTGYILRIEQRPDPEDPSEYTYYAVIEWNGDGVEVITPQSALMDVDLAYCTTVHKSQGSEYKTVLLICSSMHSAMLKRNVVYTGVTRAKQNVAIIGDQQALTAAILNNSSDVRWTLLAERLRAGMAKAQMEK